MFFLILALNLLSTEKRIEVFKFGKLKDGREVKRFVLKNSDGITVEIINYGGIITKILTPDKNGKFQNIVLGFDKLSDYFENKPYFGAIIGRYANRIRDAEFELNGKKYFLYKNDGKNSLHGGRIGFNKRLWKAQVIENKSFSGVRLKYRSKDGEEGYPGNLDVEVLYTLNDKNELKIEYRAKTDKPTIINLTNHSYFNLLDGGVSKILEHFLYINADSYTEVDEELIPTGRILPVKNTPFDFRKPKKIGKDIRKVKGGYDINYVLNDNGGKNLRLSARVYELKTKRLLEVYTTQPGLQFYSGNFLDGSIKGHNGVRYKKHTGFCLETQHFPDSPHHKNFPSVVLNPQDEYHEITIYRFGVLEGE